MIAMRVVVLIVVVDEVLVDAVVVVVVAVIVVVIVVVVVVLVVDCGGGGVGGVGIEMALLPPPNALKGVCWKGLERVCHGCRSSIVNVSNLFTGWVDRVCLQGVLEKKFVWKGVLRGCVEGGV